jgi:hypothetical protein
MQHAIQYFLLAFIAGNALWQAYTAARWLVRRLWRS